MIGLLASNPFLDAIQRTISSEPESGELIRFGLCVLGFIAVVGLAARYFSKERAATPGPETDYLTLTVDLLGLTEQDRRDLHRIARRAALDPPAAMILSPLNLALVLDRYDPDRSDRELWARMQNLSQRLFETPLPDPRPVPDDPADGA